MFEGLPVGVKLTVQQINGDINGRFGKFVIASNQLIHIVSADKDLGFQRLSDINYNFI